MNILTKYKDFTQRDMYDHLVWYQYHRDIAEFAKHWMRLFEDVFDSWEERTPSYVTGTRLGYWIAPPNKKLFRRYISDIRNTLPSHMVSLYTVNYTKSQKEKLMNDVYSDMDWWLNFAIKRNYGPKDVYYKRKDLLQLIRSMMDQVVIYRIHINDIFKMLKRKGMTVREYGRRRFGFNWFKTSELDPVLIQTKFSRGHYPSVPAITELEAPDSDDDD